MKHCENNSDENYALQSFAKRKLGPAIDETVERVLLEQGPERQPKKPRSEVAGKYDLVHKPAGSNYEEQRSCGWQQEQTAGWEKVVSSESDVPKSFVALRMGKRH